MKILVIGDSIVAGNLGVSFVSRLKTVMPGAKIINHGVDGETLLNICERLLADLQTCTDYDAVILQGGYNDILMPSFLQKGKLFGFAYRRQFKNGRIPVAGSNSFELVLDDTLFAARKIYKGRIILLTMGCISENLDTATNRQCNLYNAAIRNVAQRYRLTIADAGACFDEALQQGPNTAYCLDSFWAVTLTDRFISKLKYGAAWLSRRRGLRLTIDGVHPNARGGAIMGDTILKALAISHKNEN